MSHRAAVAAIALCVAVIVPNAASAATLDERLTAPTLEDAPAAVQEATAGVEVLHPTVLGGGIGVAPPTSGQGIGVAACYLAGVGALGDPQSVAILTVLETCTFDGVNTLALEIPCPGSVCVGGGTNFIPPPGGVRNACATGFAVFVVADGSVVTASGGGCGPI
ncbi:MAG TPA: hypothetical protein VHJ76_02900 [Actinomycetota bacterium]|nr:hypothetical protein [Actinomycetota bacterium]